MGSFGSQNYPWAPFNNNNNNYRSADCSQGVCSLYCPQFCYFFFPPPPPSNDDSAPLSPLIIAVIGVLATAFLLASYYTVVTRYCNRRQRRRNDNNNSSSTTTINRAAAAADQTQCRAGLEESVIRAIGVRAYRKVDGWAAECAVCLSEFREEEPLRLLPKCSHAFHLPCIDTWLSSQSTCPLCRAAVVGPASQRVDFVLEVLDEDDDDDVGEISTMLGNDDEEEEGIVVIKRLGRSVSLRIIGTSEEEEDCVRMMKRSVSTGGLTFTVVHDHDGGGSRGKD